MTVSSMASTVPQPSFSLLFETAARLGSRMIDKLYLPQDEAKLKMIFLLGPSLREEESAKNFIRQVKEDFPQLVHHW